MRGVGVRNSNSQSQNAHRTYEISMESFPTLDDESPLAFSVRETTLRENSSANEGKRLRLNPEERVSTVFNAQIRLSKAKVDTKSL